MNLDAGDTSAEFSVWAILLSVLVFLGIPLIAGFLTRTIGERTKGRDWYEGRLLPRIGPVALYGLLFTIVMLFALQGDAITSQPWDVVRIALPLPATRRPPRWRSPRPATTSNWPSPSPSAPSASPPARPWPASSAR